MTDIQVVIFSGRIIMGARWAQSSAEKVMRIAVSIAFCFAFTLFGCQKGEEEVSVDIDQPPISERNPTAPKPAVNFPTKLRTPDPTLNKFIEDVLEICATGDYDHFRQIFGMAYNPPNKADFDKIWYGVKAVEIISVHPDTRQDPPNYYIHAAVQLREPDSRQRARREAVVAVFKENGAWRLSPPSREVVHKILVRDSQPASEPAGQDSSRSATQSRPSSGPGV